MGSVETKRNNHRILSTGKQSLCFDAHKAHSRSFLLSQTTPNISGSSLKHPQLLRILLDLPLLGINTVRGSLRFVSGLLATGSLLFFPRPGRSCSARVKHAFGSQVWTSNAFQPRAARRRETFICKSPAFGQCNVIAVIVRFSLQGHL